MEWIVEAETLGDLVDGLFTGGKRLVRCKDCKWSYKDESTLVCGYRGFFVNDSFYCADGEREDNG